MVTKQILAPHSTQHSLSTQGCSAGNTDDLVILISLSSQSVSQIESNSMTAGCQEISSVIYS